MYPFIVKAHYWDDFNPQWEFKHTHLIIYANDFADAAQQAESYLSKVESMEIYSCGEGEMLFEVPGHIADILIAGICNYNEGLERVENHKIANKLHKDASQIEENLKGEKDNELGS